MPEPEDTWADLYYRALGRLVHQARTEFPMTQDALARHAGLTRSSITNLEAGRQRIQVHVLSLIARALKVDPADLLPGSDAETESILHRLEERLEGQPDST